MITIVGLGPGAAEDLTRRAWQTLERAERVHLRTLRHPCIPHLPLREAISFDALYEQYATFPEVYAAIVEQLIAAAQAGDVVYAVPGDPLVGEASVLRLLAACDAQGIAYEVVHGISFIEPMLPYARVDAMEGLQIVDGLTIAQMHHPPLQPDMPALLGQIYDRQIASDVKLTLMNQYPDEHPVVMVHGAGGEAVRVERTTLALIDHSPHINHLTALFVPALGHYASFEAFQEIIAHLRAPEGCPWDRKQTHASLRKYLVEEAYEVLEAIEAEDWDALAAELGDLLLQVVLQTQIAIDEGEFGMADVLRHVSTKMIRRHPHVWGDVDVQGSAERVLANWEELKKAEHAAQGIRRESLLDGVPQGLPALMVAYEYTRKAAKVGFDWPNISGVEDKVREELAEILSAENTPHKISEIGDLMFVLVNWLRWLGNDDPESVLRDINAKFSRRFRYVERRAAEQGLQLSAMSLEAMDALWDEAKAQGM